MGGDKMKQQTINTIKSIGGIALNAGKWLLVRRRLILKLLPLLGLGTAAATGNIGVIIDIAAELVSTETL